MKIITLFLLLTFLTISSANANIFYKNASGDCYAEYNLINLITINNFQKIDDTFYRGGQPDIFDIECLKKLGIKTIINLRYENSNSQSKEKFTALNDGINYINIPMIPFNPPSEKQISKFFKILNNPSNLPVYVHCWHGEDRTGIMTALYRYEKYNWSFEKAYSEMKSMGYHAYIFPRQKWFLSDFIKSSSFKK